MQCRALHPLLAPVKDAGLPYQWRFPFFSKVTKEGKPVTLHTNFLFTLGLDEQIPQTSDHPNHGYLLNAEVVKRIGNVLHLVPCQVPLPPETNGASFHCCHGRIFFVVEVTLLFCL